MYCLLTYHILHLLSFAERRRHTFGSDVWMFGVCAHELFSRGRLPYFGKTDNDVPAFIEAGGRLSRPPGMRLFAFGVMRGLLARS